VRTVLDLCCGTGTLSLLLARRGYELICADASAEMLSVFQQKLAGLDDGVIPPMLLCQPAEELDLYDTVDAAVCSLDGFNYFPPDTLPEIARRLRLFIAPGGLLCFDFLDAARLASLDGQCFVDEQDDTLCLWRASLEDGALRYGMDLFSRQGRLWRREQEEHVEYLHTPESLTAVLEEAGFGRIEMDRAGPQHDRGRLFVTALRL
jgi:SAM-dependent methyltransferase